MSPVRKSPFSPVASRTTSPGKVRSWMPSSVDWMRAASSMTADTSANAIPRLSARRTMPTSAGHPPVTE